MIAPLAATGLMAMMGQVVLLREMNVAMYGNELVYVFSLGLWLLWTAAGAAFQGRVFSPSRRGIVLLLAAAGPVLLLDVAFIRSSRFLFGAVPGAYLPFTLQIFTAALALFPVAFLTGLLFAGTARLYLADSGAATSPGIAYGVESAGAAAGGIVAACGIAWGLQNLQLACIALILSWTALAWLSPLRARKAWIQGGCAFLAATVGIVIASWWLADKADLAMTEWNHPQVLVSRDTPYGRVTLTGRDGLFSLYQNDVLSYETEGIAAEAFIHPAALQHPKPERILLLGGSATGLIQEILRHNPHRIDVVEIDPEAMNAVLSRLPAREVGFLQDPRVRIVFSDPRRFLKDSPTYDLIVVGMGEPASGTANRFYSREFFAQCAGRLTPQGILAMRLRGAENFWTPLMTLRMASIHTALRQVFADSLFLPGEVNVVTASPSPLPRDGDLPTARLLARTLDARLVTPPYLAYLYDNDRFRRINDLLEQTKAPANTDIRPICYRQTLLVDLARFFPWFNTAKAGAYLEGDLHASPMALAVLMAVVLAAACICRPFAALHRCLLMALIGFIAMVLQTVLLLEYQIREGMLYQDIGALLTAFMVGLTLGALLFPRRADPPRWQRPGLAAILFLLSFLVVQNIDPWPLTGLLPFLVMLAALGLLVSAFFAFLTLYGTKNSGATVASVYAADVLGGCLGALACGLIVIPFLGLDSAAALALALSATLTIAAF